MLSCKFPFLWYIIILPYQLLQYILDSRFFMKKIILYFLLNYKITQNYIKDVRNGDKLTELRKQYFPNGFPGSALITVSGFARPEMMVEIQAVAVSND